MKRLMTMLGVAGLAVASFAAVNDTLLVFSTPGPDKYADQTTVLDGECYALVWSAGEFAGINADGSLVNPADKLVCVAVADGGRCKPTLFQIDAADAAAQKAGNYSIYLLDTRVKTVNAAGETVTVAAGVDENGVPKVVNGSAAAATDVASDGGIAVAKAEGGVVAQKVQIDEPRIISIQPVAGGNVEIIAAGLSPAATYYLKGGDAPDKVSKVIEVTPDEEGKFTVPQGNGNFFKVIGTRNF